MAYRTIASALLLLFVVVLPARAVEVQRVVSPGGIEAWLVEDHTNPIIALDLAFRGGAALDPTGKEGLTNLLSGLLDEGAGDLDSQAFQARLQDLAIRLSFDSGLDTFQGSLQTLTEHRDTAFEMLRLALSEPRFDEEPVERIRSQILASLQRRVEDTDFIASRTLRQMLFPDHPYRRPVDGTPESLAKITVDDLRRFVAERFAQGNLKVGVVGDITAAELAAQLDKTFGVLPAEAAPFTVPDTAVSDEGGVVVIEKAVPQSVVALGQPGIKRHDPDFYTAYVVNHILGGGSFSARLYEEVREKRGLAYSVYSYISSLDHAGLIGGGVATANERVAESLALIREEWARMAKEGPTADELDDAKTYLTGSYPLRLSSSGRIAGMLVGMQLDDLGIDYLDKRNDYIEAVTLDDARRVAARLFNADALSIVVVGQPDGIKPTRPAPAS